MIAKSRWVFIYFFLGVLTACGSPSVNSHLGSVTSAQGICSNIAAIAEIPAKEGMPARDAEYRKIQNNVAAAKSCLLDKLGDSTKMKDPRQDPSKTDQFAVGDLAFFMLVDFKVLPFEDVLPEEVRAKIPDEGVSAYFDWVNVPGNRDVLSKNCKRWVAEHSASMPSPTH